MPEFQEKALILTKETLTRDVFRLTVQAPRIAESARPGQFAMIRVQETLDPLLRRPFSIHKVSADGSVAFLFKVVGKGTRMLASCNPGMELNIIGPLGRGFDLSLSTSFCMIGGGMGIAPLYFLAQQFAGMERASSNPPVLLGAQTQPELLLLAEEFTELGYPVHTATDDGSLGHHGFVTDLLDDILENVRQVYVCGPVPMMRVVAHKCRQTGTPCQVSLETHMACGLGACLGCTFPSAEGGYIHVCKDGPVFSADEVVWIL
jgi:dihydroorotate dehydrogenase electron transfer subunit